MMQIIEQTLSRLRFSTQGRLLLELALVRVCRLHDLDTLADLVAEVRAGNPLGDAIQKKTLQLGSVAAPIAAAAAAPRTEVAKPTVASVPAAAESPSHPHENGHPTKPTDGDTPQPIANAPVNLPQWDDAEALAIWKKSQAHLSGILLDWASLGEQVQCAAPGKLVVTFPSGYNQAKMYCEMPGQLVELERALANVAGATLRVSFRVSEEARPRAQKRPVLRSASDQRQLIAAKAEHPFVQRAVELFAAEIVRVDQPPE
jgi:DNA polymerase-3 subunit gamma/tau